MFIRGLLPLLFGAAASASACAAAPVEHFFENPRFADAKLSPSAKYVAVRVNDGTQRAGLMVIDLATRSGKPVARFKDVDIDYFEWVNDNRLVFDTDDNALTPGDQDKAAGLFAVNRDGGDFRILADRNYGPQSETGSSIKAKALPWNTFLLRRPGAQDGDHVYVTRPFWNKAKREYTHDDLLRLNTVTGQTEYVPRAGETQGWLLDERGQPRAAVSLEGDTESVHYRDPASGAWRKLASFPAYGEAPGGYAPLGFGADGKLYVTTRAGGDTESVHALDLATGKPGKEAVVAMADYDFDGQLIYSKGRLAGFEVLSDARATVWLDDELKTVQKEVDAALQGTVNLLRPARDPQTPWMLVKSYSDQQPVVWVLYNTQTKAVSKLGEAHPGINASEMGQQDLHRVKARDGLTVPAWLTLPKGQSKNLPMVVLVHGGPYLRGGEWGWKAQAQFLASRGYAVLEPEYRGSTGFGWRHFRAGWKQWGLAMQDDIADATKWAIAQGVADPKRICIAGASYGGYATLMGLAKNPELYRCGVQWVGVTDLALKYEDHWSFVSDASDTWRKFGLPVLVGDPVADAEQLKATSPVNLAARIRQPLLMAYGNEDYRVPIVHGRRFHDAVKPGNPSAEMVVYDGEGHGWSLQKNRVDWWTRVEQFLNKHIGSQSSQP